MYSPKTLTHVSSATEYILVYAKNLAHAETGKLEHTEKQKTRFQNPDNDPNGSEYEERELNDGYAKALLLKNSQNPLDLDEPLSDPVVQQARDKTQKIYETVQSGIVPLTYWEPEVYEIPLELRTEVNALIGRGHDPFAGSGTTGHAVLQLNKETGANRTEQKEHEPLGGGFKFTTLDKQINNQAILQMERTELIDTIIASRIDKYHQKYQGLQLLKDQKYNYLIAKNTNDEGFFLV
ncbi:7223_t:CDS:2 [Scutellospora calospora]|uniref:7223_t:CDS:1 n=1 Tax=Scutellospora calospora TaxID=85575 RepID=A0ACA9K797_9GLOM|nr:7223_t:CDS:2 [Scutellospora calospora]